MQMSRSHYTDLRHSPGFYREHPNVGKYVPAPTRKAAPAAAGMAELSAVCRKIAGDSSPSTSSGHSLAAQLAAAALRLGEGARRLEQQVAALERKHAAPAAPPPPPTRAERIRAAVAEKVADIDAQLKAAREDVNHYHRAMIPGLEWQRAHALAALDGLDQDERERADAQRLIPAAARRRMAQACVDYGSSEIAFRCSGDWREIAILGVGNAHAVLSDGRAFKAGDFEVHVHPAGNLTPSDADLDAAEQLKARGVHCLIADCTFERVRPVTLRAPVAV